jgi:hypothetical protein
MRKVGVDHAVSVVTVAVMAADRPSALRWVAQLVVITVMLGAMSCSQPTPAAPSTVTASATPVMPRPAPPPPPPPNGPRWEAPPDPARLADQLAADERVLRDPASMEVALTEAAHRQQAAYRALGRHPEWDPIVRPKIPAGLLETYDRNVDARRQLTAMSGRAGNDLPAWRIVLPPAAADLMDLYREAEKATGVGWSYLAAINLIETSFGRVAGVSSAGAQGPMQFLPSTFAIYGAGGDITSPRDSIMAAGRLLAANGFARNRESAIFRYNHSDNYVQAVSDYAAVLAADPAAFAGYHRWDVYYRTDVGDVLLPTGYAEAARIPVADYLARHPTVLIDAQISLRSEQILDRFLAARDAESQAQRSDMVSRQFIGTPYGADTLVGSAATPEQLVVELEKVDCFTYADYVEALKRAGNRDEFIDALIDVRYRDGVIGFQNRKHFFTDWSVARPAIATDITRRVGPDAIQTPKLLNKKGADGVYVAGLPVVPRNISYIPSAQVNSGVLAQLRNGDYIGAYALDDGLDVTHIGIFIDTPEGPVLRNASSLRENQKVIDTPLRDYLPTVPGIIVLRPVL